MAWTIEREVSEPSLFLSSHMTSIVQYDWLNQMAIIPKQLIMYDWLEQDLG